MSAGLGLFVAQRLSTGRLDLEPLQPAHAEELAPLLDDDGLHVFAGGRPLTLRQLEVRYRHWSTGSPDPGEAWLNWAVRERESGRAVGTTQATVTGSGGALVAELAWVIATPYQRRGYAREAAGAMLAWLRDRGVEVLLAHVHPEHRASASVARAIGLLPTDVVHEGEVQWRGE